MDERMAGRLARLRAEFETGQTRLGQLEVEQTYLRERLLMLKGAIDVLEDLLATATDDTASGGTPGESDNGRVPGAQGTAG